MRQKANSNLKGKSMRKHVLCPLYTFLLDYQIDVLSKGFSKVNTEF